MISFIQVILLLVVSSAVLMAVSYRGTQKSRAGQKMGLIALSILMAVAIVSPGSVDKVAHLVGVGRGADLVLYITTSAVIFLSLSIYLYRQADKDRTYRIARKIAIMEANSKHKIKPKVRID